MKVLVWGDPNPNGVGLAHGSQVADIDIVTAGREIDPSI